MSSYEVQVQGTLKEHQLLASFVISSKRVKFDAKLPFTFLSFSLLSKFVPRDLPSYQTVFYGSSLNFDRVTRNHLFVIAIEGI